MTPALGVIPARYVSARFPGKVLASLQGKPVLQHVWERARRATALSHLLIATDDDRVQAAAETFGAEVVRTRPDHRSGTERVAEVAQHAPERTIVNIQGDEPFVAPEAITQLVSTLVESGASLATIASPLDAAEADNPNVVKVVRARDETALYFSRARIPYPKRGEGPLLRHIGLYAYTRETLLAVANMAPSPLEQAEGLEQLCWLEAGYRILVTMTEHQSLSINTPEDLRRAETWLAALPVAQ